jgi:hypothetical protein
VHVDFPRCRSDECTGVRAERTGVEAAWQVKLEQRFPIEDGALLAGTGIGTLRRAREQRIGRRNQCHGNDTSH